MPVGSYFAKVEKGRSRKILTALLGDLDLHSHLRLRPFVKYFQGVGVAHPLKAVEFGCGAGINLFELFRLGVLSEGHGYDSDTKAIQRAKALKEKLGAQALFFEARFVDSAADISGEYDIVLLMDILEHIDDPRHLVEMSCDLLENGGLLVVSVPTHRYPKVFGYDFHYSIGHVRDGYQLPELTELVPQGMMLETFSYNTGLLSSLGCRWFYQTVIKINNKYLRNFLRIFLVLFFGRIDVLNGEKRSASLFAVFRKGE